MLNYTNLKQELTLDKIKKNSSARIIDIISSDLALTTRLNAMGIIKNCKVKVLSVQPFGGPISIKVFGSVFSLRQTEASMISVTDV